MLREGSSKRHRPKVPASQRKRVAKACTRCRLRKRRCILESFDKCQGCRVSDSTCILETTEDDPAAPTSSSTRIDHDEVVARFNQRFPEIHLKTYHSSFLLELFTRNSDQNSGGQASNKGSALCHSVRHLSQHGTTPAVVAPYPKPDIQTPGRAQANQKRALAPTDNVFEESGMLSHRDFLACAAAAVSRSEKVDSTKKIAHFHPTAQSSYGNRLTIKQKMLEDFPSRAEAEIFISAFFCYAEANWYYLNECSFRKELSELYDSGPSPTFSSIEFICLALTVFAMGSQFVHLYRPNHSIDSGFMTTIEAEVPGMRFFQHAQKIVPQIIASPSLQGLLSCLLLALYVLPIQSTEACYNYLGLALRIAISLGLHRKSAGSGFSPVLSEIHNRVFWTTYSIERRVALSLGFPETLQSKDIDCLLPQRQRDLDVPSSFRAERLLAYTKLTLLLNQVFSPRALSQCSTEDIRDQLLSWKTGLPSQLTTLDGNFLRPNVHLELHYSMIWIYIGRTALIDKVRSLLSNEEPTTQNCDLDNRGSSPDISDACADHAARIIDLIDLLRCSGQLGLFSHTDFHTCSSATVIVLLDSVLKPRLTSFPKVKMAMSALRYMATGSDLARNSLKLIEYFQSLVNRALAFMSNLGHDTSRCTRDIGSFRPEDSLQTPGAETFGMSSQRAGQRPDLALFYDMETALEECSSAELHLLGLDSLYSSDIQNGHGDC